MNKINDITNKNSVELCADAASGNTLLDDWTLLDEIEVYTNAVVPSKYKNRMQNVIEEAKKCIINSRDNEEKSYQDWINGWHIKPETTKEYRYRHLMPFSDKDIEEHLRKLKNIINR